MLGKREVNWMIQHRWSLSSHTGGDLGLSGWDRAGTVSEELSIPWTSLPPVAGSGEAPEACGSPT